MDLKRTMREEMKNRNLDLDKFGEIMDEFIRKSSVGLLVSKKEDSEKWEVTGAGCGAVMDFYIFLNAMEPIFLQMLEEMHHQIDVEELAKVLTELIKETMIGAAKKET